MAASAAEDLLERVRKYLDDASKDPTTSPDRRLFDEAELILPTYLKGTQELKEKRQSLMRIIAADLTDRRQQNPLPAVNLLIKLLDGFTWQQVCDFGTQGVPYADGLAVGEHMVPMNKLMITLLSKATSTAADAAHAAAMIDAMKALLWLWLGTPDTGIATLASNLLLDLLRVDHFDGHIKSSAQGLVWKRIFHDRDVYRIFFECTSLKRSSACGMSKNQTTIAQARLMDWLPEVMAMNHRIVTHAQLPDVESAFDSPDGLLDWATTMMVEKSDVLMYRCLIDFYSNILVATKSVPVAAGATSTSVGLAYLTSMKLHQKIIGMYVDPSQLDPLEASFLYGPVANYVATYASQYPESFCSGRQASQVTERLSKALDRTPAKWAHTESPKHDLHVLASLPDKTLLPFASGPVSLLPSKATSADALNTLATIFRGPEPNTIAVQAQDVFYLQDAAASRVLYYNYVASNPRFWNDIVNHANTVALKDLALAAINCLTSVISANWSTAEIGSNSAAPTSIATPETGHLAILSPPALEYTMPYLLKPAQSFANLVGGHGDTESAAYKIATAKFDAMRALYGKLRMQVEQTPGQGYEEILATVSKQLDKGPVSREGEVGGRIGTLEL